MSLELAEEAQLSVLVFTDWVTLGQCWNLSELLLSTCKSNGNDTPKGPCEVRYTEVALPKLPSACILRQQSPAISHRDCDKSHTCLDRSFYFRLVTAELAAAEGTPWENSLSRQLHEV